MDWCSHKAAKFAVMRWHYSRSIPSCQKKIGVWEDGNFVGAVLYGIGAGNSTNGKKYGFKKKGELAELVRVALAPNRKAPTSQIVARSIKMIAKSDPGLKMLISFADYMGQSHIGTIYQASNWVYLGTLESSGGFVINGEAVHNRTVGSRGWKQTAKWLRENIDENTKKARTIKHRYAYPLCEEAKEVLSKMAQPYPKRVKHSSDDAPGIQSGEDGADPIHALNDPIKSEG